ncbi:universal stress protein [Streptomyces lunaelactis]|uniref:universal stress protein n=1 Tax=Streptomyces lunaelactis TaxID=1535768 RepID=UPI0015846600|nr:universal stress protein [Streptomyces lunaelactis]NUK06855.1 universal stress protein [Streptomyces lunaelactis]NUK33608.1 universal stress protein [Streptomyces lunaelactis]NUK39357.1 universal stress protein [Streptomyces lunaelactis]NUK70077.1 universal stress protein [Streptomyces lunaelactis]NUK77464.1 universal stress protein [Streptomyces lunaelactis]
MSRTVTVGLDGSNESLAAAEWAAREARLRGLPLRLVNVWEPQPYIQAPLLGGETLQHWAERIPRETADELQLRHPDVEITADQVAGRPGTILPDEARDAELLVLGSRGLSGVAGFMVGSVGMATVAHTERPVVLVRAEEKTEDERAPGPTANRPVVLGLDTEHPDDSVIEFAFDAAARRATALHVVHGWNLPPYFAYGLPADPRMNAQLAAQEADSLAETLRPWRQKFPAVEVIERSRSGKPANHLVDASRDASLVVVGRRTRRSPLGAHIGPVTHAVLHHATSPVAVVPHD